jgi:phospholipid/cholesterol/gamma-HCH transport system substrate-binding protein
MKNTLETRLGLFVAIIIVAAFFIMFILGGFELFQKNYRLHALFNTAHELKVGDRVKMAGVEIGKIEDIKLANNKVDVTMKLRADAAVKTDSVATIRFAGLMGQNFVSIEFGSPDAPRLEPNQTVNTAEQPDLNAIMTKLDNVAGGIENLTKNFSGDTLDNLFGPLIGFMKDNRIPLTATISNLQTTTAQISQGKGTIGKLIFDDSLHNLAINTVSNLQSTSDEIKVTIAEARKVVDSVNAGQGSLGKMVKDEKLYAETTASMTNLKEILQKINQGDGTIGKLVNDQEFYKNAKLTLQKLDKTTEGLEDQGPLSVVGILANSLF